MEGSSTVLSTAASSCSLVRVPAGRAAASAMDAGGGGGNPRGHSLPEELKVRGGGVGRREKEVAEREMGGGGSLLLLAGLLLEGES